MFYPWDRLPACPFLVVVSGGCFAVLSRADRLEAYAVFLGQAGSLYHA
jgi:hypothetical protein